jgi:hypothetical protein
VWQENAGTYASKATQITTCRPTVKKKSFAHFDARNSSEKRLGLVRLELTGVPGAIMMALSR